MSNKNLKQDLSKSISKLRELLREKPTALNGYHLKTWDNFETEILAICAGTRRPAARPLTEQAVEDGFRATPHGGHLIAVFEAGVRFAERTHGIGEQK